MLIPWQAGMGIMVICPLAYSYIDTSAQDAGAVADLAATCKTAKYTALESHYIF